MESKMNQDDIIIRQTALYEAVRLSSYIGGSADDVVKAAEKFEHFLRGSTGPKSLKEAA